MEIWQILKEKLMDFSQISLNAIKRHDIACKQNKNEK
jgi:hypothetical protein